jgi:GT2 family glycosyltransferase
VTAAPAPTTSVLVPSFRRPASLEACLRSLARQEVPPGEVIVVWQGDDTPTRDAAGRLAAELPIAVRAVHLPEPGIVPAENAALDGAGGELILLIDDDAVAPPDWVARHAAHYGDPTVGAVGGPAVNYGPDGARFPVRDAGPVGRLTWYGRFVGHMHDQPGAWRDRPPAEVDHLVGYNMSLRRAAFGRFEEGLRRYWQMFEADACLQVRDAGYRVLFDWANVVEHRLTARDSAYAPGRGGDLGVKVGNAAYNWAFVLGKHTPTPLRPARWLYLMGVGTSQAPGPLLLPLTILRNGRPGRELAVARLARASKRAGWRDGTRARCGAAARRREGPAPSPAAQGP